MWRADSDTNDGDDEFATAHAQRTDEEQSSAADTVDKLDTDNGHRRVDDICDNPGTPLIRLGFY